MFSAANTIYSFRSGPKREKPKDSRRITPCSYKYVR